MQDVLIPVLQQLRQHGRTAVAHFPGGDPFGKTLAGVKLRQPFQTLGRILAHGDGGKAPATNRGTNQGTAARRPGQKVTEHGLVQPVDTQRLGATGGTGNNVHILGTQAVLTQMGNGVSASAQCKGRGFAVNGDHLFSPKPAQEGDAWYLLFPGFRNCIPLSTRKLNPPRSETPPVPG